MPVNRVADRGQEIHRLSLCSHLQTTHEYLQSMNAAQNGIGRGSGNVLGFWNLWVFFVLGFGSIRLGMIWAERKRGQPIEDPEAYQIYGKRYLAIGLIWLSVLLLICMFIPVSSGILFWVGLPFWFLGVVVNLAAVHSFAHTKGANTTGIYQYSRNPMYVGAFFLLLGLCLMGFSTSVWSITLLAFFIVSVPYLHWTVLLEETFLSHKYGDSYRAYMNRTARYVEIPIRAARKSN
jgi:protein-S-isoprenylcysteine O-methyltransferase Ste14